MFTEILSIIAPNWKQPECPSHMSIIRRINKLWHIHTMELLFGNKKELLLGTSLVVEWVRRHAPNAGGPGSIPAWGTIAHTHVATKSQHAATKSPHAATKSPRATTKTQRSHNK